VKETAILTMPCEVRITPYTYKNLLYMLYGELSDKAYERFDVGAFTLCKRANWSIPLIHKIENRNFLYFENKDFYEIDGITHRGLEESHKFFTECKLEI
jgi:hypothetical protein